MKDITKSPIEMVNWLLNPWAHGIERPLFVETHSIGCDMLERLNCFSFWLTNLGIYAVDIGGARFHFQMIHRSLKNSYVAGSLHPWSSTSFMQRRRPMGKYCCIGRVWSGYITKSRRNLSCSNLKYSQFVDVPANFASYTIITIYYQFST